MPTTEPRRCQAEECGAPIRFAISDSTGKSIPIDAEPDPAGRLAIRWDPDAGRQRARSCPPGVPLEPGEQRGRSHFETCPEANRFSGRRVTDVPLPSPEETP